MHLTVENFFKNKLAVEIILITGACQILFTQIFRSFFNSVALDATMWVKIILLSSSVVVLNEIVKFILRIFRNKQKSITNKRRSIKAE